MESCIFSIITIYTLPYHLPVRRVLVIRANTCLWNLGGILVEICRQPLNSYKPFVHHVVKMSHWSFYLKGIFQKSSSSTSSCHLLFPHNFSEILVNIGMLFTGTLPSWSCILDRRQLCMQQIQHADYDYTHFVIEASTYNGCDWSNEKQPINCTILVMFRWNNNAL